MKSMSIQMEPVLIIPETAIITALEGVTSLVLDWSLELERQGVLGQGMSFSTKDKQEASQVTQHIIAQNIGQIGNNSDQATTPIEQNAKGGIAVDQRQLSSFLEQAEEAKSRLPSNLTIEVEALLKELEGEKNAASQRGLLKSLRSILEGASSNLTAQGMIQLIQNLL